MPRGGAGIEADGVEFWQVECHKVVTQREAKFTNFVEWRTHKLVYRCEVAAIVCTQSHPSHALIPVNAAIPRVC